MKIMKTKFFISLCVFFMGMMFYSCASDDVTIKQKVEAELKADGHPEVSVNVLNNVVTLTGTEETEEAKLKAGEIAKGVKYVRSVTNSIFVRPEEPLFDAEADNKMMDAVNTAFEAAGLENIVVDISEGEAKITGEAKKDDVQKIMQIVNEAGPKKVVNELTIIEK